MIFMLTFNFFVFSTLFFVLVCSSFFTNYGRFKTFLLKMLSCITHVSQSILHAHLFLFSHLLFELFYYHLGETFMCSEQFSREIEKQVRFNF